MEDEKQPVMGKSSTARTGGPLRPMASGKKTLVLVCMAINTLLLNMCLSVVGPVFPIEVKKIFPRHDTTAGFAIGMVFSVATISDFISAPFVGRDVPNLGAKRMFGLGSFLVSGLMILFSFVSELHDWDYFLGYCYTLRICQGVGTAMVFVSSFALLAGTFPEKVASVSGMLEVFTGMGFMIGPAIGGVLYEYGGFKAPFLFMGILLMVGTIVVQFLLPDEGSSHVENATFPLSKIICQPRAFLMLVVTFWTSAALAFFDPTLGPVLHFGFHLSASKVGACFLVSPGIYMLLAPLVGHVADKYIRKPLMPFGCFVAALGYELLGPNTLFGVKPSLAMVLVGLGLTGMGVAFAFIPVSADILHTMRQRGYENSQELHGAIGGLLASSFSLGLTVGPVIGGTLSGSFNFGDASALFGVIHVIVGAVLFVHAVWDSVCCKTWHKSGELQPDQIPLKQLEPK